MGLNFRGQANRFSELKKNKAGFQEKSAPGPRQGIGGDEPGNLKAAEARFGNIVSPTKIKKNFYGGEAYFQDGYSGKMGGAGADPITKKSKSSPLKMNDSLVAGAGNTNKKFVDVGSEVAKAFKGEVEPKTADLKQTIPEEEKDKELEDKLKTGETEKLAIGYKKARLKPIEINSDMGANTNMSTKLM